MEKWKQKRVLDKSNIYLYINLKLLFFYLFMSIINKSPFIIPVHENGWGQESIRSLSCTVVILFNSFTSSCYKLSFCFKSSKHKLDLSSNFLLVPLHQIVRRYWKNDRLYNYFVAFVLTSNHLYVNTNSFSLILAHYKTSTVNCNQSINLFKFLLIVTHIQIL